MNNSSASDHAGAPVPAQGNRRATTWSRALLAVGAVIALVAAGRWAGGYLAAFIAWIQGLGPWGPIAFIAGYAAATVAFVPGSVLTLAAGAIFGILRGTIYAIFAATLGAAGAFLLARHYARPWIERRVAGNPRFAAIDRAVARQGLWIVFLLRLSPVFPFNLLNYALGLTAVRFRDYLVASVGMLPGTLLYVYYGKVAGDLAVLTSDAAPHRSGGYYAILAVGLAATVAVTALITRAARRALEEAAGPVPVIPQPAVKDRRGPVPSQRNPS